MSSVFSFMRTAAPAAVATAAPARQSRTTAAVELMLGRLDDYLPAGVDGVPGPSVSVANLTEHPVGLGNYRGDESRAGFAAVELKGIRLEALVRFQLWATSPANAEAAMSVLTARLISERSTLEAIEDLGGGRQRKHPFLRLTLESSPPAEALPSIGAWRKQADFATLFEYHYEASDASEGLITRIPIDFRGEFTESTLVTDEMARWDSESAATLELSGRANPRFRLGSVIILAYLPDGMNGAGVKIVTNIGGVMRQRSFGSVRAFCDAFAPAPDPVALGGHLYRAGRMTFPNADFPDPIVLSGGTDVFRIQSVTMALDSGAIVYVRALRG